MALAKTRAKARRTPRREKIGATLKHLITALLALFSLTCGQTLKTVEGTFTNSSGQPIANAVLSCELSKTDGTSSSVFVQSVVSTRTNQSGYASLSLFPNELGSSGSFYQCAVAGKTIGKFIVPSTGLPVLNIWSLIQANQIQPGTPNYSALFNSLQAALQSGVQGPAGPPGPTGPQGIQGVAGPQGPKGDKGDKGDTGDVGPAGPQGIQGPQGPQGPQGAQGIQGNTGPQGPTGPGVPTGGTLGQVLVKNSSGDYDTLWQTLSIDWAAVTGKPSSFPPSAHSHTIPDVTGLQTALNELDNKKADKGPAFTGGETDFYHTSSPQDIFVGTAISSGTSAQNGTNANANHPGIARMTSSTTANGGYRWQTEKHILLAGSEKFIAILRPLNISTTVFRIGLHESTTSAEPLDGAYIETDTSGNAFCKTTNNATSTTSASIGTLAINTWYRLEIETNSDATLVTCSLYNASGVFVASQTVNTNIPTGAGRLVRAGIVATESTTTATAMVDVDYLGYFVSRTLVR
jgi:hypothetical protein